MNVTLYYNSSDVNRLNKNLNRAATYSGTLRNSCSILDPTIVIEAVDLSDVNYMYISDFNRYYFITGISVVQNNLWAITGHVDVLMTYNNNIRSCYAVLARAESKDFSNLYIDDDRFTITSRRDFQLIEFPNRVTTGGDSFILTVAGGS